MLFDGFRDRAEDHAGLFQLFLEGCDNRDAVKHGINRHLRCGHASQNFLLAQRNTEFLIGIENGRIDFIQRLRRRIQLRRGVVIGFIEVDLRILHPRPSGLGHGQPALVSIKPPFEHPFRLALFGRNKADNIFGKALWGLVDLQIGRKSIFVLINIKRFNLLDGLFNRYHSTLLTYRLQGPGVQSIYTQVTK